MRVNGTLISPVPGPGMAATALGHNDRIMLGNDTFFYLSLEHDVSGGRHGVVMGGSPANHLKAQPDWQAAREEVEQARASLPCSPRNHLLCVPQLRIGLLLL